MFAAKSPCYEIQKIAVALHKYDSLNFWMNQPLHLLVDWIELIDADIKKRNSRKK